MNKKEITINRNADLQEYDSKGDPITNDGRPKKYFENHNGICGASDVWIYRKADDNELEILIQFRDPSKKLYPALWDTSAAGHVDYGETYEEAAVRETREEIGLELTADDIEKPVFEGRDDNPLYKEIVKVYVAELPEESPEIKCNAGEVVGYKWVSFDEFRTAVGDEDAAWKNGYVPHSQGIYDAVVEALWRRGKMSEIKIGGVYRHYKGNYYVVEGLVTHSATLEEMVLYRALYGDGKLWVRPAKMWSEAVNKNGQKLRFELVEKFKEEKMKKFETTWLAVIKGGKILLGEKQRGFGAGKYNGIGGKLENGETDDEAAAREFFEEVSAEPLGLRKVGEIVFDEYYKGEHEQNTMYLFLAADLRGEPQPSDEMTPKWFDLSKIPYGKMLPDDRIWLPRILAGQKIRGYFKFDEDMNLLENKIEEVK
jgi:8-oxo-dGTP pyrophosphatase MutT (NUDIX family)